MSTKKIIGIASGTLLLLGLGTTAHTMFSSSSVEAQEGSTRTITENAATDAAAAGSCSVSVACNSTRTVSCTGTPGTCKIVVDKNTGLETGVACDGQRTMCSDVVNRAVEIQPSDTELPSP